ncbi:hypothetical protein MLD38_036523 [Melastoma candidum]|uniref:Uncharacterized protein n=1 Tax=Melastoma candidum TaxID=119954 RepID=A0ACB9LLT5_9MYRT|nr:hypothetical protein MLD38_036523 [Melastoma candidum]
MKSRLIPSLIASSHQKFSSSISPTTSAAEKFYARMKYGGGGDEGVERALSSVRARLDPSCVNEVLGRFSGDDFVMGMRFFIWAGVQSGYRHSSYGYSKACELLRVRQNPGVILDAIEGCRIGGWSISVKMMKVVLNLCKEAGLSDEALAVLRRMRELDLRPDTNVYNTVIRLFCAKGDVGTAEDLMREMGELGLYPDMITVLEIIKGLSSACRVEDAYRLLRMIKGYGCSPNVVAYSAVLEGYCWAGDTGRALELLDEMEREGGDCGPNVVTYTSLIRCYCEKDSMTEALGLLDRMMARGCAPNRVTVSTLLDGLCKEGRAENAHELIDRVVAWGAVPKADCFSSLVVSLIRYKFIEDARRQFEVMLGCGLEPDGLASSLVIRALCVDGRVLEGFHLVDQIERLGFLPSIDSDIYALLLEGLFRQGSLTEAASMARTIIDKGIPLKSQFADPVVVEHLKKLGCGHLIQ